MENLNSETFKSLTELAEIQKQLAVARVEFAALKSTLVDFKIQREAEALDLVKDVLTTSKAALAEAEENRDAIASLLVGINSFIQDVDGLHQNLNKAISDHESISNATSKVINEKTFELEQRTYELKLQRIRIVEDEKAIASQRNKLTRDRLLIEDRNEMLRIEFKRLKNI